jgi:leader peptidase (prepilin peptidase) / N-methyltransferase
MAIPDWSLLLRTPAFETTALLLGLVVGSFANVCIHRLPLEREPASGRFAGAIDLWRQLTSVVHPPSHCPRCDEPIRPWDNVPLVSWLVLRGRCRSCRAPIAWRYPAVEAANGLLWLALAATRGPAVQTVVAMALVTALLVLALIDLEHQILPDAVTLPGLAFGLAASLLPGSPVRPLEAALAAFGGWLAFALVALAWRKLRHIEALGQGDWKMAALLGAFFGWEKLLLVVLIASASGALVGVLAMLSGKGGLRSRLPLGSFLGASGILVVFAGDPLLAVYRRLSYSLAEALFGWLWGPVFG